MLTLYRQVCWQNARFRLRTGCMNDIFRLCRDVARRHDEERDVCAREPAQSRVDRVVCVVHCAALFRLVRASRQYSRQHQGSSVDTRHQERRPSRALCVLLLLLFEELFFQQAVCSFAVTFIRGGPELRFTELTQTRGAS